MTRSQPHERETMDATELAEWRRVRDAADGDALAHLCGDDTMGTETDLRAALASSKQRWSGLLGMMGIHLQRAGQAQDSDWREAHHVAVRCYRDGLQMTERAIRDALACMTHSDDVALATTVVSLCRVRGAASLAPTSCGYGEGSLPPTRCPTNGGEPSARCGRTRLPILTDRR